MPNEKFSEALGAMAEARESAGSLGHEIEEVRGQALDAATSAENAENAIESVKSEIDDAVSILEDAIKDMGEDIDKVEVQNYMRLQYTQIGDAMQFLDQMRDRMLARARQWDIDIEGEPNA